MLFAIANVETGEVVSTHKSMDDVKEAFLPHFEKAKQERKLPENWIYRLKKDGSLRDLNDKEDYNLRMFFVKAA